MELKFCLTGKEQMRHMSIHCTFKPICSFACKSHMLITLKCTAMKTSTWWGEGCIKREERYGLKSRRLLETEFVRKHHETYLFHSQTHTCMYIFIYIYLYIHPLLKFERASRCCKLKTYRFSLCSHRLCAEQRGRDVDERHWEGHEGQNRVSSGKLLRFKSRT